MKTAEQAIQEISTEMERLKKKNLHSYYGFKIALASGAPDIVKKHFEENGCYYVSITPCGCAPNSYDIMMQWK